MILQIHELAFIGFIVLALIVGASIGVAGTRDYRKMLDKDYEKKHSELYNTIRQETRNEWHEGWSAAYKSIGGTREASYVWFREHGYDPDDIEKWYKEYLEK